MDRPQLKIAFPTDQHVPYEDKAAVELAMLITREFDPDEIIVGSDGMDFYGISKFDKDPQRGAEGKLQYELDRWEGNQKDWISAAPRAVRRHLKGNHEDRLEKYFKRHPELADLEILKLSSLLSFDRLRITGESEYEINYYGTLLIRHGSIIRKNSAYTARGELEKIKYSINILSGHTHRGGTTYATTYRGVVSATEGFCLCSLHPEYDRDMMDWQQGMVLAVVSQNYLFLEPVPFFHEYGKLKAIWREKEYSA